MISLPRRGLLAAAAASALLLSGCASMNNLSTHVSSFGEWPAERIVAGKAGSYAFERLPSQQARAAEADMLEAAARDALAKAGFTPAAAGAQPDVLVQVAARDTRTETSPWDDPLWWHGGFGYWRHGPWMAPRWGLSAYHTSPRYEREVAVLIRDRASGKPLFEARANSEGLSRSDPRMLAAMFDAALMDFPRVGVNPRRVVVPIGS